MALNQDNIPSPCIRICCLDDDNICLGCFRSLREITQWTQVDDKTRQYFLDNAGLRRMAYAQNEVLPDLSERPDV